MMPKIIYGTAWKEEKTEQLVLHALEAGFRAIDTANQRKHYYEEGVGFAVQSFLKSARCRREDLFLQSKFTFTQGQDSRKPYDPKAEVSVQVQQSFESSLMHLGAEYLDSIVLHGPYSWPGLKPEDFEAWGAMEKLYDGGKAKALGVSNVDLQQLTELYEMSRIKPSFVQNRCYANSGWDHEIREFCRSKKITYQGFSLLTANLRELHRPEIHDVAEKYGKTIPQIIFRFGIQVGMIPLTGTTDPKHMRQDLEITDFELTSEELEMIEHI